MKVNSIPVTFGTLDRESPKRENKKKDHPKKDESSNNSQSFQQTLNTEQVGSAVNAFSHEADVVASGLNAELEGKGPGLRVTLKDGSGAVVRQFTGEEFVKLREAATGPRGKLLDKKL